MANSAFAPGFTATGLRGATKIIAANDSLDKSFADYVCDGTADQVEIQAAIDALDAGNVGGRIILLEGTYNIAASITFNAGDEDIVLMLGLLGIEGTIIENQEELLKVFNDLINQPKIGIILITLKLSNEIIDFLLDFKIHNKEPFIFILPDIFQPNIERSDVLLNKISNAISDIELL